MSTQTDTQNRRRASVAHLLAQGQTQREIVDTLADETSEHYICNPTTQSPFTAATVSRDVDVIRQMWHDTVSDKSLDDWISQEVAVLMEARRMAFAVGDYEAVRRSVNTLAKLLGLNKPETFEHRLADDQLEKMTQARDTLILDLEKMADRLQGDDS